MPVSPASLAPALAILAAAVLACARPGSIEPAAPTPATPVAAPAPPAVRIEWIEDDWARASQRGVEATRPVFADMWAPWCHTCLSMQETVFLDPSLRPYVERFVWLAADTDRPENAELLAKVEMSIWPTFFVLDGADGSVQASFGGGASIAQLRAFLDDAEAVYLDAHGQSLAPDDPRRWLREGARATREGRHAEADAAYTEALRRAPADWIRRPDALVDWIRARSKRESWSSCVELAEEKLEAVRASRAASVTDFSLYAARCAEHVEHQRAARLRAQLRDALSALADDDAAALSVDDRSDLLANLRQLHLADGQETEARAVATRQRDLLAAATRAAGSPRAAMTYNWPRAEVHDFLGEGEALLADLEASVAALPDEYDPPYRLAWLLHRLGRPQQARSHAERAASLAYGPRKARVLSLLADVLESAGDRTGAHGAAEQAVATLEALPESQRDPGALASARERARALASP